MYICLYPILLKNIFITDYDQYSLQVHIALILQSYYIYKIFMYSQIQTFYMLSAWLQLSVMWIESIAETVPRNRQID